jgi:hypothetical protein
MLRPEWFSVPVPESFASEGFCPQICLLPYLDEIGVSPHHVEVWYGHVGLRSRLGQCILYRLS